MTSTKACRFCGREFKRSPADRTVFCPDHRDPATRRTSVPRTTHTFVDHTGLTCTVGPFAVSGKRCGKPAVVAFTSSTGEVFAECAEHRL